MQHGFPKLGPCIEVGSMETEATLDAEALQLVVSK